MIGKSNDQLRIDKGLFTKEERIRRETGKQGRKYLLRMDKQGE